MDSLSDIKMIKRLSSLFLITIIISLIIVITRYIGLNFFFLKIFNAFTPVFIAIFISFTLEPAVSLIDKVINKRKISVVITYFLILILMGVLSYFTVPSLVNQIELFVNDIPNLIDKISLFFTNKGFNFDIRNILESFLLSTSSSLLKYLDNSLDVLFDVFLLIFFLFLIVLSFQHL